MEVQKSYKLEETKKNTMENDPGRGEGARLLSEAFG